MVEANSVSIQLSHDQALVLFEWIARRNGLDQADIFEDRAEQRVLWDMEAALESTLPEVLHSDYVMLVDAARTWVRDT